MTRTERDIRPPIRAQTFDHLHLHILSSTGKVDLCLTKYHAIKKYGGGLSIAGSILNFGAMEVSG
jgi:hypothetical protein